MSLNKYLRLSFFTHRCFIPECEPESSTFYSRWLSNAIPGEIQLDGTFKIDHCNRYKTYVNASRNTEYGEVCSTQMFSNETIKCDQWVFDHSSSYTIVEQWNITCEENEWKLAFVGTAYFSGVIFGSLWMACGD